MFRRTLLPALLIVAMVPLLAPSLPPKHKSRAQLHGSTVARGKANYRDEIRSGKRDQRFVVQISRMQPFKVVPVRVNGRTAGVMLTNPIGAARLNLRTAGRGPADPLPSNFPRLRTGDIVTAGNMCGIVFDQPTGGTFQVTGEATAGDGMFATALYEEQSAGAGAPIERHFEVSVTGGPPETAIPIFVNGVFIDTVFTDPSGAGTFEISSPGLNDGDDAPIPDDFPSLVAGDVVDVGNASITLVGVAPPVPPGGDDDDSSDDDSSGDDDSSDDGSSVDDDSDDGNSGHGGGDDHDSDDDSSDDD